MLTTSGREELSLKPHRILAAVRAGDSLMILEISD